MLSICWLFIIIFVKYTIRITLPYLFEIYIKNVIMKQITGFSLQYLNIFTNCFIVKRQFHNFTRQKNFKVISPCWITDGNMNCISCFSHAASPSPNYKFETKQNNLRKKLTYTTKHAEPALWIMKSLYFIANRPNDNDKTVYRIVIVLNQPRLYACKFILVKNVFCQTLLLMFLKCSGVPIGYTKCAPGNNQHYFENVRVYHVYFQVLSVSRISIKCH
jgi:hypothetical protein